MRKRSRSAWLRAVVLRLDKLYGSKRKIKHDSAFRQALHGALAIGTSTSNAARALNLLEEDFIDWNEVRISSPAEIAEVAEQAGVPLVAVTALKRLLSALFEQTSELKLDFPEKEQGEDAYQWLMKLPQAPPEAAAEVAMVWFQSKVLPVDEGLKRVLQRIGLIEKGATDQAVKRSLLRLASRRDYYRVYRLLTDHAGMVCTRAGHDSEHCPLLDLCEAGQQRVEKLRRDREAAAEAAKAAEVQRQAARARNVAEKARKLRKKRAAAKRDANAVHSAPKQAAVKQAGVRRSPTARSAKVARPAAARSRPSRQQRRRGKRAPGKSGGGRTPARAKSAKRPPRR